MTVLQPIAQKCAQFICRNDPTALADVEKLVENSLQGLFHTIVDSVAYSRKVEYLKEGFLLSDNSGFKDATKDAILGRINLINDRDEFLSLLFNELKETGGMQHNRWKMTVQGDELALYTLEMYVEKPPSTYVKAKAVRFNKIKAV